MFIFIDNINFPFRNDLPSKHIYGKTSSLALACNVLSRLFVLEAVMSDDTRQYYLLRAGHKCQIVNGSNQPNPIFDEIVRL